MNANAILLSLPLLLASTAFAQRQALTVDPAASEVDWSLGSSHDPVKGTFQVQNGTITFDHTPAAISGTVVVSAASGKSGNDSRDKKMKNDVLDVPHYADLTFSPKTYSGAIAPSGDSTISVAGTFTLHGTPHDLTVPMQIHIEGASCTAKTHFTVPYVQWGLKDPSIFILKVAKQVDIDLTLKGTLSPAG